MFEAARSYIAGAKIIIASDGIEEDGAIKQPTLPVIVCCAIAIEILLKAILNINEIPRPKGDGHDLNQLFLSLPIDKQCELLEYQSKFTEKTVDQAKIAIFKARNVFKTWRYAYEHETLEIGPDFLLHFSLALSEYIKSKSELNRSENGWKIISGITDLTPRVIERHKDI